MRDVHNNSSLKNFITSFWPYIRPYRWAYGLAYLGTAVVSLTGLSIGFFLNARLDEVLKDISLLQTISEFALLIVLIIVVRTVISFASNYTVSLAGVNFVRNLRTDLFGAVMQHGDSIIEEESSGELQTRVISDTSQLGGFVGGTIPTVLGLVVAVIGGVGGAIYVSPSLALLTVGATVMLTIPILASSKVFRRYGERLQKADALTGRHAGETFRARDIVYAFNQLEREQKTFRRLTNDVKKYYLAQERLQCIIFGLYQILVLTALVFGASYAINLITSSQLTIGTVASFVYFALLIVEYGTSSASVITTFNVALGRAQKLMEILQLPAPTVHCGSTAVPDTCAIVFLNVCFTYPTRQSQALQEISLGIPFKTKFAIVGASGSG